MRLCAMGMVADGELNQTEKETITEVVLRDYISNYIDDIDVLSAGFKDEDLLITRTSNDGKVEIRYKNSWTMVIDVYNSSLFLSIVNYVKTTSKSALSFDNEEIDNTCRLYGKARYFVEGIIKRLESGIVQQGLFVNVDTLNNKEVFLELRDMILVIKADSVITEQERVAFMCVAKIMGVRGGNEKWEQWMDYNKSQLETLSINGLGIKRRQSLLVQDAEIVADAITTYKIRGPFRLGMQKALMKSKDQLIKSREILYKTVSKFALLIFVISAIIVYSGSMVYMENKNILENFYESESHLEDLYVAYGNEQVASDIELVQQYEIEHLVQNGKFYNAKDALAYGFKYAEGNVWESIIRLFWSILILLTGLTILKWGIHWLRYVIGVKRAVVEWIQRVAYVITVGAFGLWVLLIVPEPHLEILYFPFFTTCMMISIELMIFMRERYSSILNDKNKDSSRLLVIFVVAAIVADFCIGYIELPCDFTVRMLMDKFAGAIMLGCISFFVGKFLDTNSKLKQTEIQTIEKSIKSIDSYLSNDAV